MNKEAALLYIKEKSNKGYMIHPFIIDNLYEDSEEVPQDIIDACCYIPEPPKPTIIFMGSELMKKFKPNIT